MKRIFIVLLICISLVFFFGSCKKKQVKTQPTAEPVAIEKVDEATPKVERPELTEEELFEKKTLEEINAEGHLIKIHFDFDKYHIKEEMKPILHRNADWLLKHPSVVITIEGHCDERGTIEYNMALGEKRAKTARNFLETLGVSGLRMQVVSYGKSKPAFSGANSEETHYQNRRSEFVIIKK